MGDGDDVASAAPQQPAARNFRLRLGQRDFAAQHQRPDFGPRAAPAVTAMKQAIAIAGLPAPLSLKPQNRPRFHIHSNHQTLGPLPPREAPCCIGGSVHPRGHRVFGDIRTANLRAKRG